MLVCDSTDSLLLSSPHNSPPPSMIVVTPPGQARPVLVAAGQTSCVLVLCLVVLAPSEMLFNGVGTGPY